MKLRKIERDILQILNEAKETRSGRYEGKADLSLLVRENSKYRRGQFDYTIKKLHKEGLIKRLKLRGVYSITDKGITSLNGKEDVEEVFENEESKIDITYEDEVEIGKTFRREAEEIWGRESLETGTSSPIDNMEIDVEIREQKNMMSIEFSANGRAIGNTLISVPRKTKLFVSGDAMKLSKEDFRNCLRHEAVHIGYPKHDKGFREIVEELDLPHTYMHLKEGTIKVQVKIGHRYKTIKEFDNMKEAEDYGIKLANENTEKKYRLQY